MRKRRYEILLPLTYNDGGKVEDEKFEESIEELIVEFGNLSIRGGTVQGRWLHEGVLYKDDCMSIFIDVDNTPETRQFFKQWKPVLIRRFEQIEIYMTWTSVGRV